ncbi:hypothetical protein CC80DRAFT_272403 [Byssothecium circinans]|uniref:Mid2 domain-containing protein n=1 Tax=Byssothecium circinans TaxID=147558 RepID=A0A6A5TA46_9PLEO|nr:hypothetical protein CC80DRAFT_272403 [Byssothecium circinans]
MSDFSWVFPPGDPTDLGDPAMIGPVYFNDEIVLQFTPANKEVKIDMACDIYYVGQRKFNSSPSHWRITEASSIKFPECHFAFADAAHGNGKVFQYIYTANPEGSKTWSATQSPLKTPSGTSTSGSSSTATNTAISATTSDSRTVVNSDGLSTASKTTIFTNQTSASSTTVPATGDGSKSRALEIGLGVGISVAVLVIISLVIFLLLKRRKLLLPQSRDDSGVPSTPKMEMDASYAQLTELDGNSTGRVVVHEMLVPKQATELA